MYALCHVLATGQTPLNHADSVILKLTFVTATISIFVGLYLQASPATYYIYVSFALFFWHRVLQTLRNEIGIRTVFKQGKLWQRLMGCSLIVTSLELMVVSPCNQPQNPKQKKPS